MPRSTPVADGGLDDLAHPGRQHAAVGVAQHDDLGAGVGGGPDDLEGVLGVGPVAVEEVLTVDEHPASVGDEMGHRIGDHGEVLLQRGVQGAEDVLVVALGDDADHLGAGVQQRLHLRILGSLGAYLAGGPEGDQLGVLEFQVTGCGAGEELGVVGVGARPAALDEADPERHPGPGDRQLVRYERLQALLLGAVAQRGVEDVEGVGSHGHGGHGSPVGSESSLFEGRDYCPMIGHARVRPQRNGLTCRPRWCVRWRYGYHDPPRRDRPHVRRTPGLRLPDLPPFTVTLPGLSPNSPATNWPATAHA